MLSGSVCDAAPRLVDGRSLVVLAAGVAKGAASPVVVMSPSEPSEWQRLKEVFNGAVLLPPSRRTEYLDAACDGDADLRREAERLLASHDADSTFLESPAAVSYDPETSVNLVGRKIGPYRANGCGAGGMGVVYKAHDTRLNRTVAIKVLPAHLARDPQFWSASTARRVRLPRLRIRTSVRFTISDTTRT